MGTPGPHRIRLAQIQIVVSIAFQTVGIVQKRVYAISVHRHIPAEGFPVPADKDGNRCSRLASEICLDGRDSVSAPILIYNIRAQRVHLDGGLDVLVELIKREDSMLVSESDGEEFIQIDGLGALKHVICDKWAQPFFKEHNQVIFSHRNGDDRILQIRDLSMFP